MNKDIIRKVLRIVCGLVFLCAVGFLIVHFVQEKQDEKLYKEIQEVAEKPKKEIEEKEEPTVEIPIDFEKLQEENPDIYAWIQIPGTKIDYPILQNGYDDSFYLDHTADGAYGAVGSIYTERQTAKDFSDFNTVIYGHNVPNGTMFRGLHQYEDAEYLKEHPEIIIYTPDAKRVYTIFAAVVYEDRHILNTFDFTKEFHRQEFIDSVYQSRNMANQFREDVSVTPNDRILTLSTCIKTQRDKRYIVGAVLTNEEKAKNSDR